MHRVGLRVLAEPLNFVFQLQFLPLQFGDADITSAGMNSFFLDRPFERLMAAFKFLKMRVQ
jgi:hypothetical protein